MITKKPSVRGDASSDLICNYLYCADIVDTREDEGASKLLEFVTNWASKYRLKNMELEDAPLGNEVKMAIEIIGNIYGLSFQEIIQEYVNRL